MKSEPCIVVTFASTFDALEVERRCRAASVPGRIIPTPPEIDATCGLAWRLPADDAARDVFDRVLDGAVHPAGYRTLLL